MAYDPRNIGGNPVMTPNAWPNSGQANQDRMDAFLALLGGGNRQQPRRQPVQRGGFNPSGLGLGGGNTLPGQQNTFQNAGSRQVGSVNYGAVAGLQNALQWSPNPALQAAQFRAQGVMPTSQGVPLDMAGDVNLMRTVNRERQNPNAIPGAFDESGYLQHVARTRDQQALAGDFRSPAQRLGDIAAGRQFTPQQAPGMGFGNLPFGGQGTGAPYTGGYGAGGGAGAAASGGTGPLGLPLENPITQQILGILNRPSPYSAEQQARLRSQATSGLSTARDEAVQRFRQDAARRGLNPNEIEGGIQQLNARYDQQGQGAVRDFEAQQALMARQGLLQGIGAGTGLMGQQIADEDSLRRYLAILGQAQAGQTPLFLSL